MTRSSGRVVLDPSGHVWVPETDSAPRIATVVGKNIGILDDGAPNSGHLMDRVGDLLVEQYGAARILTRRKDNFSRPAPAGMIEELGSSVDAVVVGVGA